MAKAKGIKIMGIENVQYPKVEETEVKWGEEGNISEGYKGIVNPETKKTYYIGSDEYKLVRHEDAIEGVKSVIEDMPEFGEYTSEITFLDFDGKMEVNWTFTDIKYEIGNGDIVNPRIIMRNSYDGGWAFSLMFGAFRLVCSNGLTIGEKLTHYKKKHTEDLDLAEVKTQLKIGMEKYSNQVELWKTWVDKVTTDQTFQDVKKTLTTKEFSDIMELKETGSGECLGDVVKYEDKKVEINGDKYDTQLPVLVGTMKYWIFMNILEQYITHNIKSVARQTVLRGKLNKIM